MAEYRTKSVTLAAILNYVALPFTVEMDQHRNCVYIFQTTVETCAGSFDLDKSDLLDRFHSDDGLEISDARKLLQSMQHIQRTTSVAKTKMYVERRKKATV